MSVNTAERAERRLGGRYLLENPIGEGGMSTVYKARDEVLGRVVAVKLFDKGLGEEARQEGELAILANLDHHALVSMLDAGTDSDVYGRAQRYLVMALVKGDNLRERLHGAPMTSRHIGEIGYDMAEALEYIHMHNVIHRDIKPSNILLIDYGNEATRARAKLTDFGIALADDIERMTAEGATTGTAAYLSPEQASGQLVGPPSDIYSLGLVLLQCFTRKIEFPGSIVESAVARLSRDPVMPKNLPSGWRNLLSSMTSRRPSERPSARELTAALRQLIISESGRHKEDDGEVFASSATAGTDLARSEILDTLPNESLHRVTAMAARLFSAPIAIVSVVDRDRTWFKSYYGAEVAEVARAVDLSKASVPQDEPVVIENTLADERLNGNDLVYGDLGLRFYAGVPLKRQDGRTIGTLSVLDFKPSTASEAQIANLQDLAALVVTQLELRQEGMRAAGDTSQTVPITVVPPTLKR